MADIFCDNDLSLTMREVSGIEELSLAVYRRLITPATDLPGGLLNSPEYGVDLVDELQESFSAEEIKLLERRIEDNISQDDRILSVDTTLDFNTSTQIMTVKIRCISAVGPFELTLAIDDVSVEILRD